MRFHDDERGLAVAIVGFFAMIIIAALLYTLFGEAMTELFAMTSGQAQTTHGTDQINLAETIWNNMLFYALAVAVIFLIARAVVESRGPA